jgi:molecular chaperone GrpE
MSEYAGNSSSGAPRHPAQSESDRPETVRQAPVQRGPGPPEPSAGVVADSGAAAAPGDREGVGTATPADRSDGGAAEFEDRWRRAAADLDNLRKRYAREVGRERVSERELVASAFLPVLDNIDRALEHAGSDPQAIIEGIRTVREQALAVLSGLGYRREDQTGVPFDPSRHEVVGTVEAGDSGRAPGSVASVVRPGYAGPDRQLRPAAVTVAQGPES